MKDNIITSLEDKVTDYKTEVDRVKDNLASKKELINRIKGENEGLKTDLVQAKTKLEDLDNLKEKMARLRIIWKIII